MDRRPTGRETARKSDFPYYRPLWKRLAGILLAPVFMVVTALSIFFYFRSSWSIAPWGALVIYSAGMLVILTSVLAAVNFLVRRLEAKRRNISLLNQQIIRVSRLAVSSRLSRECLGRMKDILANIDAAAAWAAGTDASRRPAELRENLEQIREQAKNGHESIGSFLELTRPPGESWLIRDLDIHELLDELLDIFEDAFSAKQVRVEKQYADVLPVVRSNPSRVSQIFQNLFLGVLEDIDISRPAEIRIHTREKAGGAEVAVVYPSLHFDEDLFSALLDPLKAAQAREPGPWLALCAYTAGRVKGEVSAHKTDNQTLKIAVRLPLQLAEPGKTS